MSTITVTETITPEELSKDERTAIAQSMFLAPDVKTMEELDAEGKRPLKIVWPNVIGFGLLHLAALLGLYQFIFEAKWLTSAWAVFLWWASATGITAGSHRLWSHRSYKATLPARIILMIMSTTAYQNDVIEWARDHRCHHKWTDTEADPHDSKRGFFYSHIGWLLVKKSDKIKTMGAKIDLSDLFNDPVLSFQRKHYRILSLLFCFLIPTAVPVYFWGESAFISFYVAAIFRMTFTLNITWLINSAAHMFGYKPYDASISAVQNVWTSITAVGEGAHNFHHTFPQDYRASELQYLTNWTTALIDVFAAIGWAYDLKCVGSEALERQKKSKGDVTNTYYH